MEAALSRGEADDRALLTGDFVHQAGLAAAIALLPHYYVDQAEFDGLPDVRFASIDDGFPPGLSRYQLAERWLLLQTGSTGRAVLFRPEIEGGMGGLN